MPNVIKYENKLSAILSESFLDDPDIDEIKIECKKMLDEINELKLKLPK